MYTVSITSQGQISIPAKLRKSLGFSRYNKALITVSNDRLIIKPSKNLFDFAGAFHTEKQITSKQIRNAFIRHSANTA